MKRMSLFVFVLSFDFFAAGATAHAADRKKPRPAVSWGACSRQKAAWYKTPEAMRIADNVLFYQAGIGGWYKNDGSIHPSGNAATELLSDVEKRQFKELLMQRKYPCTLDNDATHSEMRYLAKVYAVGPYRLLDPERVCVGV